MPSKRLEQLKYYLDISDSNNLPDNISEQAIDGLITSSHVDSTLHQIRIDGDELYENEKRVGHRFHIARAEDMQEIMNEDLDSLQYLLISTSDWHVIPLENLIAKLDGSRVKTMAVAESPKHVELLAGILELGVDICIVKPGDVHSLEDFIAIISHKQNTIDLVEVEVNHVERIGMGDRVCVDTVSILAEGEGMLVGSTAELTPLIQAEVLDSGFVNSRPFRVNAGVVASYTIINDKTKYLSEMRAGSRVMIVNREGITRTEHVARVKIERRPLILIRMIYLEKEYPVVLQDAETVRLMTKDGSLRVDKIKEGDKILASINTAGRHFGMAVGESIEER